MNAGDGVSFLAPLGDACCVISLRVDKKATWESRWKAE